MTISFLSDIQRGSEFRDVYVMHLIKNVIFRLHLFLLVAAIGWVIPSTAPAQNNSWMLQQQRQQMQLQQQRLQMQRQMEQQRLRQQQMAEQQRRQREMMAQQRALREQQRQQREQMRLLRAQREQQKLQRDQQRTQREQQQALREQRQTQDAARVTRQQQAAQRQQQTQRQATQAAQRQSALSAQQQQAIRTRLQQTQKTKQLDEARRRAQQTLERKRAEDARKKAETAAVVSGRNAAPAAAGGGSGGQPPKQPRAAAASGGGGSGKPPNGQPKAANDNRRVAVSAKLPNTPKSTAIKFPGPKLPDTIAATFQDGKYSNVKLSADKIMYKYHGVDNRTGQKVTWLTDRKYSNETELRRDLAIKKEWGVKLTSVSAFKVPKGTWISEGKAAGQGHAYPGGGYQAVVQNVPKSWLIRTDRAFQ
ncbi:hypothetical protein [Actibacterium ureilyticum]|uniref:hypothetical protein n=1 Tax=Actibacterium ureilyticum TaxID=1590614 RepID=UPI001140B838|nr:hypothetical protein [Actibacterium ureilyticum]